MGLRPGGAWRTTLTALALVVGLAACGAAPLRYTPVDEVSDGPGLLSGEAARS
jgi:predicted small lipoprotein YifL